MDLVARTRPVPAGWLLRCESRNTSAKACNGAMIAWLETC
jgi:hypothetical protein